ncbi:MAG: apolipoprotein N-acyltransferase [Epsilonproteobacteria bacterium]|nr:apolipoprotein N-acyltransferase [Campylobacterota bacterium]
MLNTKNFFQSGFFLGLLLFWWIGGSFKYYSLSYLIPFAALGIGLGYGILFWLIGKILKSLKKLNPRLPKAAWAVFLVWGFDYLKPFSFDWLKPEIILSYSIFAPTKTSLFLIVAGLYLSEYKKIFLLIIPAALLIKPNLPNPPQLKINLVTTHIPQEKKWQKDYIPKEIAQNFKYIQDSIGKYDVVVLPESAFPIFLNLHPKLLNKLSLLSKKITIITGALHLKNKKFYNSTYIFEDSKIKILDKHILVPFGEYIPLPFFQKEINEIFFEGASDYATSKHFNTFTIKNTKFINAICYEATVKKLYTLKPKYIIALSNLAWFHKLAYIEQKALIKAYAYQYGKIVFHSINGYESYDTMKSEK